MATARSMLATRKGPPLARPGVRLSLLLAGLGAALAGCNSHRLEIQQPVVLLAPYAEPVIWAVAPLANESGVSIVDELAVSDDLVNAITEVEGLTALPVNRTLEAMRVLGVPVVRSPRDAQALARALGVDAIVVGTITAWYPYEPPRLGMNLAVYSRTRAMDVGSIDPVKLSQATTDSQITPGTPSASQVPVAAVSRFFDASNHAVVGEVRAYAVGRTDNRSVMGDEIYTKSMERYTQFVCFEMVDLLLDKERARLTVADATQ